MTQTADKKIERSAKEKLPVLYKILYSNETSMYLN